MDQLWIVPIDFSDARQMHYFGYVHARRFSIPSAIWFAQIFVVAVAVLQIIFLLFSLNFYIFFYYFILILFVLRQK